MSRYNNSFTHFIYRHNYKDLLLKKQEKLHGTFIDLCLAILFAKGTSTCQSGNIYKKNMDN